MNPILSILTPTIPGREAQVQALSEEIARQIGDLPVEHLILSDNRKRSIGAKRQDLVDIARGQYIAFVDDDDRILPGYVAEIVEAAKADADVITFHQLAFYNGAESVVEFRLGQGDGPFVTGGITKRDAWHVCAWHRKLVRGCTFADNNYGEDLAWCRQARRRARIAYHIDKTLHVYRHDAATTAAPEPVRA